VIRDVMGMLRKITGGIPAEGSMIAAFENAFLEFGITRPETVKRYMSIMERKGLIIRKGDRWFRADNFSRTVKEEPEERDDEVDGFLENMGVNDEKG